MKVKKQTLKIKNKKLKFYDFFDLVETVDKKIGYDQRSAGKHFFPDTGNFTDWHKLKGYGQKDSEGKHPSSSQIWFSEYQKEISEGVWKDTPYLDFWHWQMDNCFSSELSNDSYNTFYVGDDINHFSDKPKEWQLEIQRVYKDLFFDISKDGYIEVSVSW